MKLALDTESDFLALDATVMHIMYIVDIDTEEEWHFLDGDLGWIPILDEATHITAHNLIEHDLPLLKKLFNWTPNKRTKQQDTLIMSRALDYRRFQSSGHALEAWGDFFGDPKLPHEDFSVYSEEMFKRCQQDTRLHAKVYKYLMEEFKKLREKKPLLEEYLLCEHAASKWVAMAHMNGWPFDTEKALVLQAKLFEKMNEAEEKLVPLLGKKVIAVDKCKGVVEPKYPKWTMQGAYYSHTADWFGVDPWSGYEGEERMIAGPYSRITVEDLKLSSTDDVKIFLYRHGWVPLEWNSKYDPVKRKKILTSPKITEESLEFLGGDGKLYKEYAVAKSRHAILTTWIESVDEDGRVHGDCVTIGTPSMRARHQIIVNVPAMESKWGPEMRELFIARKGWKLIGTDSSGNQGRGLAHYLGNDEYTDILINDDIHVYNALKLEEVLKGMGEDWRFFEIKQGALKPHQEAKLREFFHGNNQTTFEDYINGKLDRGKRRRFGSKKVIKKMRAKSKRIYYAFLFGAGGTKLWGYAFLTPEEARGNQMKNGFIRAVPGFESLTERLKKEFSANRKTFGSTEGFILSLAGNRLYVDSFHKLLVYLLQAAEKITCAAAIKLLMEYLEEEEIPYEPHMFMHDEVDYSVPPEYVERAKELGVKAFTEGPKLFNVMIMTGESKAGNNWKEVH